MYNYELKFTLRFVLRGIFIVLIVALLANAQNYEWWIKNLEDKDVRYGYYDSPTQLVVVDKNLKTLRLFNYENGALKVAFDTPVIVGKNGDKLKEGDLKTPVGVYQLTRRFVPSDRYLGPLAFSLSYPNLLDKAAKRNGSGIWIHGYPLDGFREDELKTKGCVAMQNDILMKFDTLIKHEKALALIYEHTEPSVLKEQLARVFSGINSWKSAWKSSDIQAYLNFYDTNFTRYDGMNFANFKAMKRAIFSRKEKKRIEFSNFSVTPYPNLKNEAIFRVSFFEKYTSDTHKFEGQKTLYVRLDGENLKIFVEE